MVKWLLQLDQTKRPSITQVLREVEYRQTLGYFGSFSDEDARAGLVADTTDRTVVAVTRGGGEENDDTEDEAEEADDLKVVGESLVELARGVISNSEKQKVFIRRILTTFDLANPHLLSRLLR